MSSRRVQPAGLVEQPAVAAGGERPVALHALARKGRGATGNVAHRFESMLRQADGDALDAALSPGSADGECEPPPLATTVRRETARSLIAYNDSPDLAFDRSINPYRGCEHGCIYCYARPTHAYLDLSPGLDFETRLSAKVNAVERLRAELAAPGYRAAALNLGSATDAYQPIERDHRLARGIVALLVQCRHPFSIVTKSSLVERDLDLLQEAAKLGIAMVFASVTSLDSALSRRLEPRAASPARRLRTVETLAAAGVPVHVNVAPLIPFINEPELERVLAASRDAGACAAHYTILRLPWEVGPLFEQWLQAHFPDRAERVMNRVREMHGGRDYRAEFGLRMKGDGPWAALIRQRFETACRRLGLDDGPAALRTDLFVPPARPTPQLDLF